MRVLSLIQESRGCWGLYLKYHHALRKAGIDSNVLSLKGDNESSFITEFNTKSNRLERRIFIELKKFAGLLGLSHFPDLTSVKLIKALRTLEYDILYIVSARLALSYLTFPWLIKSKPTIFNVTSMWSFTGHCHYSFDCSRWKTGCGKCPYPNIPPPIKRDSTRLEWKLKNWAYKHSNFTIITTSNWMNEQVRQSMLKRFPVYHIPEGIDTDIYRPLDKERCRLELKIPLDKNVLMFVAASLDNYRKGGDILVKALKSLPKSIKNNTLLMSMGSGNDAIFETIGMQTLNLGYIGDHDRKAACYSAADLLVFPTRADTFPMVSVESLACGTPVVSFRTGGLPDSVHHGITGYLADPENVEDFRNGIIELIKNEELRKEMSQQCRALVEKEYSLELYVQRFIRLCGTLVQ